MTETEHLLVKVMEECAEVAHRASKALRFGLEEVQEGQLLDNGQRIVQEFSQLYAIIEMLEEEGHIKNMIDISEIGNHKRKYKDMLKYSNARGKLTEE